MISLEVVKEKNLLILNCERYVTTQEALNAYLLLDEELKKIKPGFIVISNIRKLNSSTRQARIFLQKSMRKIDSLSPQKVIRVVENTNGALIFDRAGFNANVAYEIYKVNSDEEAIHLIKKKNDSYTL